jgi:polysaccharide biosynthesis transport protein
VNAVVETYVEKAKAEEFYGADTRLESLMHERGQLLKEIQGRTALRTAIAQELGVSVFTETLENPYDRLLAGSKDALAAAKRLRLDAEAQLAAVDETQRPGAAGALRALAAETSSTDPGLNSLKSSLNQRRSDLLGKISGLSPVHPGREVFDQELRAIDGEIKRSSDAEVNAVGLMTLQKRRAEVYRTRRVEKELTLDTDKLSSLASWFAGKYQEALALGLEIDRARKRVSAIDDRVNFLSQESRAAGFVRLFSLARPPEMPTKGGRKKLFVMVVVAGVALGVGVPIGVDALDPRIHAATDVERILGFPPLGWILERDGETSEFVEDQLFRLAYALDRERTGHGTRSLLLTSVASGGGNTTLVLELARKLTSIGIPTLALEANPFKPDARFSGAADYPGLTAVLTGKKCPERVLLPADGCLPDRIGIGNRDGKRNLPSVRQLGSVLEELGSRYSLVIVDAPPVSLSGDTALLIGLADATILVIEAEDVARPVLQRVARNVERLNPPVVGCILNRVRAYKRGGYFASLIEEFRSGRKESPSGLTSPWLWR